MTYYIYLYIYIYISNIRQMIKCQTRKSITALKIRRREQVLIPNGQPKPKAFAWAINVLVQPCVVLQLCVSFFFLFLGFPRLDCLDSCCAFACSKEYLCRCNLGCIYSSRHMQMVGEFLERTMGDSSIIILYI